MQPKNELKIVLTGGHAGTTALATIESLKKGNINWNISWIGSKRAVEGKKTLTLEFKVFPNYGIKCYEIITGRFQKRWSKYSLLSLLKIPFGFLHALYLLLLIRPKLVISFGGFAAFPVVVMAWALRIPVIVHEQTIAIGLANKLSIPFAARIAISRKESKDYFPANKTVLIGNPVRAEFFRISPKVKISEKPVIYATGGSRGSQIFNRNLKKILPILLKNYLVIHQTGELDFAEYKKFKEHLPSVARAKYKVYSIVDPITVPKIFERADIVIGRAGANTVAEVIAASRPAIFIPIPWSRYDEQSKNAMLAESAGLAEIIHQDNLTPKLLFNTIEKVRNNWRGERFLKGEIYSLDIHASDRLAKLAGDLVR